MPDNLLRRMRNKVKRRVKPPSVEDKKSKRVFFNANPEKVLASDRAGVVFVHVGKCAGTSIKHSLINVLPEETPIFEMHCYDANDRIQEIVASNPENMVYLIAKRDPVARFISAFNWDKHNLYFAGRLKGKRSGEWYDAMPTINALANALMSEDVQTREMAKEFSAFGHMRMGQSWYTPNEVLDLLPRSRTFVVDMQKIRADMEIFFKALDVDVRSDGWELPRLKSDYTNEYKNPSDDFPKRISDIEREAISKYIAKDLTCYERLGSEFGR